MKNVAVALVGLAMSAAPLAAQHAEHSAPPRPAVQPPAAIRLPSVAASPCPPAVHGGANTGAMDAMTMMDSMMAPMRWLEAFYPERLLGRSRDLGLTPDQDAGLVRLGQGSRNAHDSAHTAAREHARQLSAALDAPTPDVSAVGANFDEMLGAMAFAHGAELRIALQARALLTEAQRRRVDAWRVGAAAHPGVTAGGQYPGAPGATARCP